MRLAKKTVILMLSAWAALALAAPKKNKAKNKTAKTESEETAGDEGENTYQPAWGMAGCGLFSRLIKDKSRGAQLGVSVLRLVPYIGSLDSQTSGITSGTSNCVAYRSDLNAVEKKVYITINLASLSKESAQGSGQHIDALAEIFGCPHSEFAQFSQRRYGQLYDEQDPEIILENYLQAVPAEPSLSGVCTRVG